MEAAQYLLECVATGVHARVSLDDVPVLLHERGGSFATTLHVNPWLADATTTLSLEVAGALDGETLAGALEVTLVERMIGEVEREVARVSLPRDADEVIRAGDRWLARQEVGVPGLLRPETELWRGAQPLTLRDEDRAAIHEAVLGWQRALDVLDAPTIERAFGFQLTEAARAYHVSRDELCATFAALVGAAVGDEPEDPDSDAGLADLEENMELHLCGRDRLVWVTRSDYGAALRVPAMKARVLLPIYVAPRNGRWTIVR